jgi:hypothetical protein
MPRAAGSQAAALPAPARQKPRGQARGTASAAPRVRPRTHARVKLPFRLIAFVVCLALLAVGRVTLSFAVVQKNLQTDAVVREYRQYDAANARLAEDAAGMSSSLKVHSIAVNKYKLVVPATVEYITLSAGDVKKARGTGR